MNRVVSATSCVLLKNSSPSRLITPLTQVFIMPREHPPLTGLLTIPGGKIAFQQTWQQACSREVKEETGYLISPQNLSFLHVSNAIYKDKHFLIVTGWGWQQGLDSSITPEVEGEWMKLEDIQHIEDHRIIENVKSTVQLMKQFYV